MLQALTDHDPMKRWVERHNPVGGPPTHEEGVVEDEDDLDADDLEDKDEFDDDDDDDEAVDDDEEPDGDEGQALAPNGWSAPHR